jgi:ribosomal protein S13
MGLSVVAKGVSEAKSRVVRKDEVVKYSKATQLDKEDLKAIREFAKSVDKAPVIEDPRALTLEEQEAWIEVEVNRRKVEDINEGLKDRDRSALFNHFSFTTGDPYAEGTIVSLKHGMKGVAYNSERTGKPNYEALKDVLPEEVWKEIVNVTYEVDEEKIAQAMVEGKITMDQFSALVPEKKIIRNFTVKPLKEGDSV